MQRELGNCRFCLMLDVVRDQGIGLGSIMLQQVCDNNVFNWVGRV